MSSIKRTTTRTMTDKLDHRVPRFVKQNLYIWFQEDIYDVIQHY